MNYFLMAFLSLGVSDSFDLGFKILPPALVGEDFFREVVKKDCESVQDRFEPLAYTMKPAYEVYLELSESGFDGFKPLSFLKFTFENAEHIEFISEEGFKALKINDRQLLCRLIQPLHGRLRLNYKVEMQPEFRQRLNQLAGILNNTEPAKIKAARLGFQISGLLETYLPAQKDSVLKYWSKLFKTNSLAYSIADFQIKARLYEIPN